MLRLYFMQQWFNRSDAGVAEAVYDSASMRAFVDIDLGRDPAPDATTVCKQRDPEMCQTKKGNPWYFGMQAHIGVDSKTKLIHSVLATRPTPTTPKPYLLHGKETRVRGDSAYTGQTEVIHEHAPCAQDFTHHKGTRSHPLTETDKAQNRTKSKVRATVEHPFRVMKFVFGFVKVRYRGLMKSTNRVFTICAPANLYSATTAHPDVAA